MGLNKEPQRNFRCDDTTWKKLDIIAHENQRNKTQQIKYLILKNIKEYEAEHGEISIEQLEE